MTASERKKNSERILNELGIPPFKDQIPEIEEEDQVSVRFADEIAARIVILGYLNCAAYQPDMRKQIVSFLESENYLPFVSEREHELFGDKALDEDDLDFIAWRNESIHLLLWVIGRTEVMPLPTAFVEAAELIPHIPPFFSNTIEFLTSAHLRSKSEIMDQADLLFRLHWAVSEAGDEGQLTVNPGIVAERHLAIDWVIRPDREWE